MSTAVRSPRASVDGSAPDELATSRAPECLGTESSVGQRRPDPRRSLAEFSLILVAALLLGLFARAVAVDSYYVTSGSMSTTLERGDRVLVNKLAFGDGIEPGHVVVFNRPAGLGQAEGAGKLVKRVVGMPGQTLVARGGVLLIDGEVFDEEYLDAEVFTEFLSEPVVVPDGHVYVMGDNREHSEDSRFFGPISEDLIVGRAMVIVWPLARSGSL